jgi:hypothetical protein
MPAQNSLSRRSMAAVGGAAHGGYGADVGDSEVLSVGQPGGLVERDVAGGDGSVHSQPFDRDVEGGRGGSNRERLQELHRRAVGAREAAKLREWGFQRRGCGRGEAGRGKREWIEDCQVFHPMNCLPNNYTTYQR